MNAISIECLKPKQWQKNLTPSECDYLKNQNFKGLPNDYACIRNAKGELTKVIYIMDSSNPFSFSSLVKKLPQGNYQLKGIEKKLEETFALAWQLEAYDYSLKADVKKLFPTLENCNSKSNFKSKIIANAIHFGRNLINMPANILGTVELETEAMMLAQKHNMKAQTIVDTDLIEQNFPLIYAVGMGSTRKPRLVDLKSSAKKGLKITLVGKGIVFDTGGLDIKPPSGMKLMKKDMGGAATALALADMIMSLKVPVQLRVLLPIAENSISGDAFRPSDVFQSRKGLTVEIGDTDAEGRLVLADALSYAQEDNPDIIISLATLTGAARVALGPEIIPFYSTDEKLAQKLSKEAILVDDPLWHMPLWAPYAQWLNSKIADVNSIASQPFAGSITAALFLQKFVSEKCKYMHFDLYGWNATTRPAHSDGGEIQAARAILSLIEKLCDKGS